MVSAGGFATTGVLVGWWLEQGAQVCLTATSSHEAASVLTEKWLNFVCELCTCKSWKYKSPPGTGKSIIQLYQVFYLCVFKPDKYHTKIVKVKSWTSSHKESFSPQRAWDDADEMPASPRNWVWDTRRNTIDGDTNWNYPNTWVYGDTPDDSDLTTPAGWRRHTNTSKGGSIPTFSFSLLLL